MTGFDVALSHFEIRVRDAARMEDFYTRVLGFVASDRGAGERGLVFLSRSPGEHHQIVLNPGAERGAGSGALDHLAFRAADLGALRALHAALRDEPGTQAEAVSHGTTWSVYFRDPEGNRLELFVDTPWHVAQPVRFPIDLDLPDEALVRETEARIRDLADFQPAETWRAEHARRLANRPGRPRAARPPADERR